MKTNLLNYLSATYTYYLRHNQQVCGTKSLSCINKMELRKALKLSLSTPTEESDKIFQNAKIDFADTTVNFGMFYLYQAAILR